MAEDEDDYLSDKFLAETAASTQPKSYHDKRKEALRRSQLKNEQNRQKSRRQRELESREAGLSKSLFERAGEESASGSNKALAMMMKMGFKPGQALGADNTQKAEPDGPAADQGEPHSREGSVEAGPRRLVQPLAVNEWAGKRGIGLGKRAASPSDLDRLAKVAKAEEQDSRESFRDRARREFEQRRAEGRLVPAQRTCANLDEQAGKTFNVYWLNPTNTDTFPDGLLDALEIVPPAANSTPAQQLRAQMRADALTSLEPDLDDPDATGGSANTEVIQFTPETVEEAVQFLRLAPQERLSQVVEYLRSNYSYCFWCGAQYEDAGDMTEHCPGPDEDMHD
ncbi:hypothetical protein FA95DRAFT_1488802 [Auriscalpium vulgare]|uniref:Uncharacterized protein n=1 Tax=Auriscalpium vulgare TaxID=40419 RepID=A0ACB8S0A6_9AGAM|nr:hypothetical protein FA95DRAFT_1488802 [Auriscalpium vulgare]